MVPVFAMTEYDVAVVYFSYNILRLRINSQASREKTKSLSE